ncbi:MAG TPA: glycosyltransferase family 2 protein [Candidatus Saccharimonadales bacterium]|nr:glycosyltransferase family 2 protein [Candidatus Saccharimonadales bacterium]
MKLFVQIPCLNEEDTLPDVLETIPIKIGGIDSIDILIIDDGSTDKTIEIAKKHGVKHFVMHRKNQGLAKSFSDGLDYCLSHGADIIVNTDGDNQYPQQDIPKLVQPILDKKAEIVIADRQTDKIEHFSPIKKFFQKFGSWVVNKAAGTNLPDAASGFRAYSKEAAVRINVITTFSYCMETIIHAGNKRIPIESVKIITNPKTRESRLFKNMWQHMYKSGLAIIRSFTMHKPYVIFMNLGLVLFVLGLIPFIRYGVIYISGDRGEHIQSLILGVILLFAAMISFALGIIADLIRTNRILIEDTLERTKKIQHKK